VVEGVAMFDTATTSHHELLVATAATMGAGTTPPGEVPPMLRELVGTSRRVAADASAASATEMVDRLAGMDTEEQRGFLVDLVRREVAAVLVHPSPETIHLDREFQALGFNSLTAVELRNRLGSATGLRLPATLVFDYATPAALAEHLRAELVGTTGPQVPSVLAELDRLEAAMAESEPDEITRNGVAERLRQLLSRWSTTDSTPESTGVAQRFESASADEILDFIDNELGRSRGR
ncbi:acyl carrier protein, partial [Amycolatopsis cihanbeyliensis]